MKQKIQTLQTQLAQGLINREDEIKASLLTMIAGENIVLVGPPGTGKSMVARKMSEALAPVAQDNNYFEYLLTKFSTPEEIFGPLSISELKKDNFVRNTAGYLPTARVAFLDEIFKASSSILNALLTVLNERKYHNGTQAQAIPLQTLVSASNELPNGDESLSALYDRFLVRKLVDYVDSSDIPALFNLPKSQGVQDEYKLTQAELDDIRQQAESVVFPDEVQQAIMAIWAKHKEVFKEDADEFLSDRKLFKVLHLLRVSAVTNERDEVDFSDVMLLKDCLWNHPNNIVKVRELILAELSKFNNGNFSIENTVSNAPMSQPKSINLVNVNAPVFPHSTTEGQIIEWNFAVGDKVKIDDVLVEIETDKVVLEIVCQHNGMLHTIIKDVNDVVQSQALLALIDTSTQSNNSSNPVNNISQKASKGIIKGYRGSGTADDPILISTVDELLGLQRADVGQKGYHFKQVADIDCSHIENWINIDFIGNYNGSAYRIIGKNSFFNDNLFQTIDNSNIKNLYLKSLTLSSQVYSSQVINVNSYDTQPNSIFIHEVKNSEIINCSSEYFFSVRINNSIIKYCKSGANIVADKMSQSKISDCYVKFKEINNALSLYSRNNYQGGIARNLESSTVERCYTSGTLYHPFSSSSGYAYFSGITANSKSGLIKNCAIGQLEMIKDIKIHKRIVYEIDSTTVLENNISISTNDSYLYLTDNENGNNTKNGLKIDKILFTQFYFENTLGWDFDNIWEWDNQANEPRLRQNITATQTLAQATQNQTNDRNQKSLLQQQLENNIWLN